MSKKKIPLVARWWIVGSVQVCLILGILNTPYWITNQAVWWAPHLALLRDAYPLIGIAFQATYLYITFTSSMKKKIKLQGYVKNSKEQSWFNSLPLTYFYELSDKQIQRASDAHNVCPLDSVFTLLPAGSSIFQSYEKQLYLLGDSHND